VHHVFNRGSRKGALFTSADEYIAFERLLAEACELRPMRILAYCLMPNHWHLLLWPEQDSDVSRFLHWVTGTHALRWRRQTNTHGQGAVYQGRFGCTHALDSHDLLEVWRYIERNPVEASLVVQCEDWLWSSASERSRVLVLDSGPIPRPPDWLRIVNRSVDVSPAPPHQDRMGVSDAKSRTVRAPGHCAV
jgi:putative transposase